MPKPAPKPVGTAARTFHGITIRKSEELPQGVQALYFGGRIQGVFRIGEPVPAVQCDSITLNPLDYELALKSELDRAQRDRRREWHGPRSKVPTSQDVENVLRAKDFRRRRDF